MVPRGTTPTIRYTFSIVEVENIASAYLTIQQGSLVIEKSLADADVGDGYLEWNLSQSETLSLDEKENIEIQCKYKMTDGKVYTSKIYTTDVYKILKEDII